MTPHWMQVYVMVAGARHEVHLSTMNDVRRRRTIRRPIASSTYCLAAIGVGVPLHRHQTMFPHVVFWAIG